MNSSRSELGPLNRALQQMVQRGYADEARAITQGIRNLDPLTGPELKDSRQLLLMALRRRGPFAPEWDHHTPRGIRRPAIG